MGLCVGGELNRKSFQDCCPVRILHPFPLCFRRIEEQTGWSKGTRTSTVRAMRRPRHASGCVSTGSCSVWGVLETNFQSCQLASRPPVAKRRTSATTCDGTPAHTVRKYYNYAPRHVGLPSKSDNILIALIPEADTVYSSKPSQRVNPCTGSRGMFNRLTDASPSA
jgi:hypothetical protein